MRSFASDELEIDDCNVYERGSVYKVGHRADPKIFFALQLEDTPEGVECTNIELTRLQAAQLALLIKRAVRYLRVFRMYPEIAAKILAEEEAKWDNL
jgi:ribosomal protein L2